MPEDFKTARVTPVYKGKGDKSDPNNYRPISVVPILAKILEKQVKVQLINYLSSNRLLNPISICLSSKTFYRDCPS